MNFTAILGILSFVATEFPKLSQVFTDFNGIVTGTKPAVHPNTGSPVAAQSTANETMRAVQKLLNQYVKPQPLLVEDGLWGKKTEAAMKQGLALFGVSV